MAAVDLLPPHNEPNNYEDSSPSSLLVNRDSYSLISDDDDDDEESFQQIDTAGSSSIETSPNSRLSTSSSASSTTESLPIYSEDTTTPSLKKNGGVVKPSSTSTIQSSSPSSPSTTTTPPPQSQQIKPLSISSLKTTKKSIKKKRDSGIAHYIHQRQLKITFFILSSILLTHFTSPTLSKYTTKCLKIQYIDPNTNLAQIGLDDAYFVGFWLVVLTFLRSLFVDNLLLLLGAHVFHIRGPKKLLRFSEQLYADISYATFCFVGLRLMVNTPYWLSVKDLWIGWPHYLLDPYFKAYYLIEFAAWIQQIYVINIEERRKDHYQMFVHHIITCSLMFGSYYYYFTRVGNVILVLMDFVDIFLCSAKVLRYVGFQKVCDAFFVLFLASWLALRHGLYNFITYSALTDASSLLSGVCAYDEQTNAEIRCFSPTAYWCLIGLLVALQIITIGWLFMIIRVLIKVLSGNAAEDSRSDEEDDDEEEEEEVIENEEKIKNQPLKLDNPIKLTG